MVSKQYVRELNRLKVRRVVWARRIEYGQHYVIALCTQCVEKLNRRAIKEYPINRSSNKYGARGRYVGYTSAREYPALRYMVDNSLSVQIQDPPRRCAHCGFIRH